tara:strand:- start:938 stop:1105 length:168 start_codon:yes stop_codon:yes gene_type:complete
MSEKSSSATINTEKKLFLFIFGYYNYLLYMPLKLKIQDEVAYPSDNYPDFSTIVY